MKLAEKSLECEEVNRDLLLSLDNYLSARAAISLAREAQKNSARDLGISFDTMELDFNVAEEVLVRNLERFVKCKV